eukprot:5159299-Amphidinium_carterae.1
MKNPVASGFSDRHCRPLLACEQAYAAAQPHAKRFAAQKLMAQLPRQMLPCWLGEAHARANKRKQKLRHVRTTVGAVLVM